MSLKNKCLVENVVNKSTIRSENETKSYFGSTGGTFKKRWYSHISDFKKLKRERNKNIEVYMEA